MQTSRIALSLTALLLLACSPEEREFSTEAASSSGAGGAGGEGGAGGAGGSEPACMPGEVVECYSGPEETKGVGLCKSGTQTCRPDQTGFGPCEGEIVPAAESCVDAADEDCDAAIECGDGIWSKGAGDASSQVGTAIATDKDGNVIVIGTFDGTLDFGKDIHTTAGFGDVFVAKLGPDGSTLWSRRFGSTQSDSGLCVAVTPSGDIVVGGQFQGAVDFGNGPLTSAGLTDMFLVKLGAGGVTLWSKRFGDSSSQSLATVTVDPAGHVIVAGGFLGLVDFGTGPLMSAGSTDVFVAKFSPMGMPIWAKRFGDGTGQAAASVATDAAGNIVLGGTNSGSVDFGGGPVTTFGSTDVFVAKLDAGGGAHIWSKGFGDPGLQALAGVAVDKDGNVAFGGRYTGTVDFGGGPVEPAVNGENIYAAKLTPAGEHVYSRGFVTDFVKHTGGLAMDGSGNLVMVGYMNGSADLGFGVVVPQFPSDMYVMKLDPSGSSLWAKVLGAEGDQQGRAVAVDPTGHVFVTGSNEGNLDFGQGPLVSAGLADVFVAKLAP